MSTLAQVKIKQRGTHKKWDQATLYSLGLAIDTAWSNLTKANPNLSNEKEEDITTKLQKELDRLKEKEEISGFIDSKFETIERGAKTETENSVEKAPDLTVRKKGTKTTFDDVERLQDALFIECKKLVSKSADISYYINGGIFRFYNNEYAWAMPNAMMVGYNFGKLGCPKDLIDFFKKNGLKPKYEPLNPVNLSTIDSRKFKTVHVRKIHTKGNFGNIDILHFWL